MKFTHLHVHSHYSLLDGLPKIDNLIERIKELNMDACALTDHGVMYGAVEFYEKAKKAGIKPIIGVEIYIAIESMLQKRPGIDNKRYHMVLLAKNETGYRNLVKLVTKAHLEGFYYKPRIDENLLAEHSEGLIGFSGCLQGKIPQLILQKKFDEAKKTALKYKEIFEPESFYLELQHHPNNREQNIVNEEIKKMAKELGIPLVATQDTHYLRPEDAEIQDILMLINTGADINDKERLTMRSDDFSIKPTKEMAEAFKDVPEAIENTQKITEMCNFEFKLGETKLPYFETPNGESPEDYLRRLCYQGLEKKSNQIENKKEAISRLEMELSVIKKTGFSSYFLIVQDFVNWAKSKHIVVGPGRGSVGGSIVAFLLDITSINPIKHKLMFERFLNPERISMPDIDMDFTDRRRDEVIEYVAEKYGRDKVAQIITFGRMAARAVIRDVGRAMGLSYNYCDKIAKMIPFGMTLDETLEKSTEFRQVYEIDQTAKKLINIAKKLEGVARHASTHACGVVISANPLDEIVPLQRATQNEKTIVTQYEMHSIEKLGLLKMDFLGLKNLTIIEDALARIYTVQGKKIDISEIPFDDKKTYKIFQEGKTTGVFQFESEGMKKYLRELKPKVFEDIVAMVALYRPGPMQFIPEYIQRAQKRKKIEYLHPKLKPILESTQGICIFQEQLMQIARDLAGFSLSEADILRKAVGKKIESLLVAQKEKFVSGMVKNNIKKEVALRIWNWVLPFARYGFNKSHSVAYGMIAYQTAYLKAHYPVEFMAALLTSEKSDTERIAFMIEECKTMGIEVLPPDINESFRNFSVVPGKNQIRFGLFAIKNVGENVAESIITERKNGPFKSFADFVLRMDSNAMNKKSMESLIKAGAFDKFEERNKLLQNLEEILLFNREYRKAANSGQNSLFGAMSSQPEKLSFKLSEAPPAPLKEMLAWEKELLGLYISSHPLENYKGIIGSRALPIKDLETAMTFNQKIRIGGIVSSVKKILTKKGQPMAFVKLEDLTSKVEVVVFPSILERNPEIFQEDKIIFVEGRIDNKQGSLKIIADEAEEIVEKI